MNVVNYAEGARLAGVSRNMISKLKKLHNNKESTKSYFVFDPETGKPGINIDDNLWRRYVDKVNKQRSNQKVQLNTTKVQPMTVEKVETVNKNNFATAVYYSIKETKKFTDQELKGLLNKIDRRYKELEG